jgi:acyl carrier protein
MTPEDTASQIRRIIYEQFDVSEDRVKPEAVFVDDLGADSLRLVDMTLAFEEMFDIDIEDEDVEKILTVQDAIDYVEKRTTAQPPRANARRAWMEMGQPQSLLPRQVEALEIASALVKRPAAFEATRGGAVFELAIPPQGTVLLTLELA